MKERLLEFLKAENKSSAQLAEEIGVQPSGISHILSGRNNPSLDFVLKMLEKYQFLSTDWLLFGNGSMYKEIKMQSLFDEFSNTGQKNSVAAPDEEPQARRTEEMHSEKVSMNTDISSIDIKRKSQISRIVMFYSDSTFEEFAPREINS